MRTVYVLAAGNERGGAASHLVTYAKALSAADVPHDVHVVFVVAGDGYLLDRIEPVAAELRKVSGDVRAAIRDLTRLLQSDSKVALHVHGPRWNMIGSRVARRLRRRWTSTIHSDPMQDFLTSRWKTLLYPRLNARALRSASGLFVVHPELSKRFPKKDCRFVPNAVEPVHLTAPNVVYRKQLRDQIGVDEGALVAGTAARLDKVKDIDTVIRAISLLPADRHFAVAGDGPERAHLEQLAAELGVQHRVHFLGFIERVHEFYAGLDVHVLSSLSEGTPSSVLEAGWLGIPNVGTAISGITHLIVDDDTGCTVPVGDAVAMAAAMSKVLTNPDRAHHYAERFAATVLPRFTPERMVAAYMDGYERFFGEREGK